MQTLTIQADMSQISDFMSSHILSDRMKKSLSLGIRNSLAIVQQVHKTSVIGQGDAWVKRTGEASRSFHTAQVAGQIEGAYGSELTRIGVLEMGTQEALGGPLRPRNSKYLAIPMEAAKVGRGRAVSPKDRDDLFFVMSRKGNPVLLQKGTGKLMFVLRREVTIQPHPTLPAAQERAQPAMDAAMLAAIDGGMFKNGGAK